VRDATLTGIRSRLDALPDVLKGILCVVAATVVLAGMNGAIRQVSAEVHPFVIAFFRNLFGLLVFTPMFLKLGLAPLRSQRPGLHLLRASFNVVAMLLYFYALSVTPLALVSALGFVSPLFATIYAMVVLRERVRLRRWTALIVGFVGTLIIVRPGSGDIDLGGLYVIASSAIWAMALMVIKILSRDDRPTTITAMAALLMTPLSLVPALFVWQWPSGGALLWLMLIGALGTLGQIGVAQAFRFADVSAVLPFDFLKLIWAAIIGFLAFSEVPGSATFIGGAVIFASATYIAFRESRIGSASARERAAAALASPHGPR